MIAEHYPWPAVDGIRQRLDHVVRGLARVGEVELIALDRRTDDERRSSSAPELPELVDVTLVPVCEAGAREWLPSWIRGGAPRRLLATDWTQVAREVERRLAASAEPPIDLVWYSHVDSWWPLHDAVRDVAAIADFYDLVNLALRLRRRTPPRYAPGAGVPDRARTTARWAVSRGFDLVDERRWDRVQRECAAHVDRVVVCSELDRTRLALPDVEVIGNGSVAPAVVHPDRRALRGDAPTFLFVGALDYEPNSEAVEWFVRDVFPSVRRRVPTAQLRVVGRGADRVAWIAREAGVELVGRAPEMQPELDRADVSLVPIRVGAGTRLKVVEALANHLPLVTTPVGCEGIDLTDGRDALITDDPQRFADDCVRLATDGELRQRLADAGSELFAARYDWDIIERDLAALASRVVAEHRPR